MRRSSFSIDLAIALHIPETASLISADTIPIIPEDTLIAIILRVATPFYLQTGRPIQEIRSFGKESKSDNRDLVLGTSIPLSFLAVCIVGTMIL